MISVRCDDNKYVVQPHDGCRYMVPIHDALHLCIWCDAHVKHRLRSPGPGSWAKDAVLIKCQGDICKAHRSSHSYIRQRLRSDYHRGGPDNSGVLFPFESPVACCEIRDKNQLMISVAEAYRHWVSKALTLAASSYSLNEINWARRHLDLPVLNYDLTRGTK